MAWVDEQIEKPTGRAVLEASSRRLLCDVLLGAGLLAGILLLWSCVTTKDRRVLKLAAAAAPAHLALRLARRFEPA